MKPIINKKRQWFLGVALIVTCVAVWWAQVWSPLQDQRDKLEMDLSQVSEDFDRLKQRLEKFSDSKLNRQKRHEKSARFFHIMVPGETPEAVSAYTQLWVQGFLENHDLLLKAYKGLSSSKWRDYPLVRTQFQLSATTQGLSDLLETLQQMEKAVTIEKLSVDYRRSRENDLRISLNLGTLFLEGHLE